MDWGSFRDCTPFLSAAIAALVLYRLLESLLGLTANGVFFIGLYGAAVVATPLAFVYLVYLYGRQRQRNK
jgi:hypothetical protein